MTDETDRAWRAEYAHRYVARMLLRPPWPRPAYVRLTDEQIAELPEGLRGIAYVQRELLDQMAAFGDSLSRSFGPQARSERPTAPTPVQDAGPADFDG